MTIRPKGVAVLLAITAAFSCVLWFVSGPCTELIRSHGLVPDLPSDAPVHAFRLHAVSNASGLALVERDGRQLVATVDEVDEWNGGPDVPPLITFSDRLTGARVGGERHVAEFGEVEALAERDGRLAFPYKTDRQAVVLRWGDQDIPVVTPAVIAALDAQSRAAGLQGALFYEFEGLAWHRGHWELLAAVVRPDVRETPSSTMAVTRLWFDGDGGLKAISPFFREATGGLYHDYAAALCVVGDDLAVVPGFFSHGVTLFDRDGRIAHHLDLPTTRVEGVAYDALAQELFLVRECVGEGSGCGAGVHFGVTLWVASIKLESAL